MPLAQAEANRLIDASVGTAAHTAPTGAIKCKLTTDVPTATASGTEVTGGTYAAQTVTFAAAATGTAASNVALNFTGMPAVTVQGVRITDSNGTPRYIWGGGLTASKTLNSGDTFTIASGSLTLAIT